MTTFSTFATATYANGNIVVVQSAENMIPGLPITFAGNTFGNLTTNATYYIGNIVFGFPTSNITLTSLPGGAVYSISNGSGNMVTTFSQGGQQIIPTVPPGEPLNVAFDAINVNFDQIFAAGPVGSNIQIDENTIYTLNTNGNLVLNPNGIGNVIANAHVIPDQDRVRNLGAAALRWNTIYAQNIVGNIAGNIVAGGSNGEIQFNNNGILGGANGFTYNTATNAVSISGNLTVANVAAGNIVASGTAYLYNISSGGVSSLTTIQAATLSASGNITGNYFFGNGSQLTGIDATSIQNGNSNVRVVSAGGNVAIGVGGTSNVVVIANNGQFVNGIVSATGGFYGDIYTTLIDSGDSSAILVIPDVVMSASLTVNQDLQVDNEITAVGNITGNYFFGNGSLLTGIITSVSNINNGTSNVTISNPDGNVTMGVAGVNNVMVVSPTDVTINGNLTVTGNATLSGNILGDRIQNGNTQIDIQTAGGNANVTVGGVSNVAVFTTTGLLVTGLASVSGNITGNYFFGNGSQLTGITADNVNADDLIGNTLSGNVLFSSLTSVGTLSNLSVAGTVTVGNISIPSTGNVLLGNVNINNLANPVANSDAATKFYVDSVAANVLPIITNQTITPNGSANTFVLDQSTTAVGILVTINGVTQTPTVDYTVTGNSITIGETPLSSDIIQVRYLSGTTTGGGGGTNYANANVVAYAESGWGGNIIPQGNLVYNLGNSTNRWNDLYLSGNTIYLDSATIGANGADVTFSGNVSANYITGNGSQLTGITATANTGNVTFSGEAVIGTGTSNTQSGLYLAPDPGSLANDLYLRVRGNILDEPTHIHFDTGNNQYYNLIIGDDNKYIQLANTGNIVINTNNYAGNTAQWNFDTNGVLTVPASNVVPARISTQTTTQNEKGFDLSITAGNTDGCSVPGGDLYLSAGVGYNGISHGAGNVNIVTGDRYGNIDGNIWRFDSSGALTLPMSGVRIKDTVGNSVAFGLNAGFSLQGNNSVAIGSLAGNNRQGNNSVAIGNTAGAGGSVSTNYVSGAESPSTTLVVTSTTGIGPGMIISGTGFFGNITVVTVTNSTTLEISASAGFTPSGTLTFTGSQGNAAVAIGPSAGSTNQGSGAVAVGDGAGQSLQGVNAVAIGLATATTSQGSRSVAIGQSSGQSSQGADAVAIGQYAGNEIQGVSAVAIGNNAGYSGQSTGAVAIGSESGLNGQGELTVAVGYRAGRTSQGNAAVSIGAGAGNSSQGLHAVAIGTDTGATTQGNRAVAIGYLAGSNAQGTAAVAIGYYAGELNQGNNSIIINATDTSLQQTTANTFTVAPVRNDVANIGQVMFYNTTSKEITYGNTISVAGNITGNYIFGNGSQLTGLPATYGNANVATFLAAFGSNTISTSGNVTAGNFIGNISITGNVQGTSANVTLVAGAYSTVFDNTGNLTLPGNTFAVNYANNTQVDVVTRFEGTWTVPVGNSTQSFTVSSGTYSMWVEGNIPNGIIVWNATGTVTNTNVPVAGVQYAWVYNGGGTPIDFTSIPNQFVGTANTIVRSNVAPSATTNRFDFGINNASGGNVTVRYGWIQIS
jgi:hypothetical protein